jgi:hypothetical protein
MTVVEDSERFSDDEVSDVEYRLVVEGETRC